MHQIAVRQKFSVQSWPEENTIASDQMRIHGTAVISLVLPENIERDIARQEVRLAITTLLAVTLACPPEELILQSLPAQGLRAYWGDHEVFVSISHATGLSIAAMSFIGKLGVDLIQITETADWQDVSRMYLGETITSIILTAPTEIQSYLFAQYWTALEAHSKYMNCQLTEYDEANPERIDVALHCTNPIRSVSLNLPDVYIGTLIFLPHE